MGTVSETSLSGKRWYIAPNDPSTTIGLVLFALIACAFTVPAVDFVFRPAVSSFLFGITALGLWALLLRALRTQRAQYELVVGKDFVRWGWSHDLPNQELVSLSDVVELNYRHSRGEDTHDELEFVTRGGMSFRVEAALSDRRDLASEVIEYLLVQHPRITVRLFE